MQGLAQIVSGLATGSIFASMALASPASGLSVQ